MAKAVLIHAVLIVLAGIASYSNTLDVPFQLDERDFIVGNPIVKEPSLFLSPSEAAGYPAYEIVKNRFIGYLTFALNYKIHGLDVTGYHIVNITIHLLNAFLVYFLVILTFKTPNLKESSLKENNGYVALFSALLFVSHPVQTEAVTYIFQRLASLTALFCLLSLVMYITWRLRQDRAEHVFSFKGILLYLSSILSLALAMKTKENAFMFPVIIILYEFFFFKGAVKKRILFLVPILLTMLIIPLSLTGTERPLGEAIGDIARGHIGYPRYTYFLTELRVIATYIRLALFPVEQNFIYDYPVYRSIFETPVILSLLLHVSSITLAILLFKRNRPASFGIIWFYIALLVESSIIPLPMLINEYRMYLPAVGAVVSITAIAGSFLNRKVFVASFAVLALLLSYISYERNSVWQSEISLWEDVARKSPRLALAFNHLGNAYGTGGNFDKARTNYLRAIELNPTYGAVRANLGLVYAKEGRISEAIDEFKMAVNLLPDYEPARFNLGVLYMRAGQLELARRELGVALELNPGNTEARRLLGGLP